MSILAAQLNLLQGASVDAAIIHQVERHSRSFFGRNNLSPQRNAFVWTHIRNGSHCGRVPVFIVKSGNDLPGIENSEGSRKADFAILRGRRFQ